MGEGGRELRRIGSRRDVSRGGRELRRIGSRRDMSGWVGGGGREPRRIDCRSDMGGGSSKSTGSQSLRVIFCN